MSQVWELQGRQRQFILSQIQLAQQLYEDFIQSYDRESLKKLLTIFRFFTDYLEYSGEEKVAPGEAE